MGSDREGRAVFVEHPIAHVKDRVWTLGVESWELSSCGTFFWRKIPERGQDKLD